MADNLKLGVARFLFVSQLGVGAFQLHTLHLGNLRKGVGAEINNIIGYEKVSFLDSYCNVVYNNAVGTII